MIINFFLRKKKINKSFELLNYSLIKYLIGTEKPLEFYLKVFPFSNIF